MSIQSVLNKIIPWNIDALPQMPQDKANHHAYAEIFSIIGGIIAFYLGWDPRLGSVILTTIVGIAKELWDKYSGKGDPSVADCIATMSGSLSLVIWYTFYMWATTGKLY